MKRLFFLTIALLLISALTFTSVLAAKDPFIGTWESIDIDGSYQMLTIGNGPGNTYSVRYYDFGASGCGRDPETNEILYAASARGFLTRLSGTLPGSDGTLQGTMPVYCMTHPPTFIVNFEFVFEYDASTDTIGGVWNRK